MRAAAASLAVAGLAVAGLAVATIAGLAASPARATEVPRPAGQPFDACGADIPSDVETVADRLAAAGWTETAPDDAFYLMQRDAALAWFAELSPDGSLTDEGWGRSVAPLDERWSRDPAVLAAESVAAHRVFQDVSGGRLELAVGPREWTCRLLLPAAPEAVAAFMGSPAPGREIVRLSHLGAPDGLAVMFPALSDLDAAFAEYALIDRAAVEARFGIPFAVGFAANIGAILRETER